MWHFYSRVAQLVDEGRGFAIAHLVKASGSSPQRERAKLIVHPGGATEFTIGGGTLEEQATQEALRLLRRNGTRVEEYELEDLGMYCGGRVKILYEVVGRSDEERRFYDKAQELLERGRAFVIAQLIKADRGTLPEGLKMLVYSGGEVEFPGGEWPSGLANMISEEARSLLASGGRSLLKEYSFAFPAMQGKAKAELFLEVVKLLPRLLIFGAGHVGAKLARLAAATELFRVEVADDRKQMLQELEPLVDQVYLVDHGFRDELPVPDERTFVAIITRAHQTDEAVLRKMLSQGSNPSYLGMIGSTRKRAELFRRLREEGISDEQLEQVQMPIGLPIGGKEPGEIAVSVLAEIIKEGNAVEEQ